MAAADDRLAAELGVPADLVKIHRGSQLTEGLHYLRAEGGRIDYTAEGEVALKAHFGPEKKEAAPESEPPPAPPIPPEKKEAAPPEPGKPVLLKLLRLYPNPTWIDVQDGIKRVRVQVKNNLKITPDKRVLCRQWPDGRWECCQKGQAVPLKPLPQEP